MDHVCEVSLCTATVWDMAQTQGTKSEISCLEEVDIEPVSFAGIVIVIKNISGKEEKSFARGCNISVSKVLLHLSFPCALRSSHQGKRVLWQVQF